MFAMEIKNYALSMRLIICRVQIDEDQVVTALIYRSQLLSNNLPNKAILASVSDYSPGHR